MKKTDPLSIEEMTAAAEQFFPLLNVVNSRMPDNSSIEDTLKVMETVAKLGHKLRADKLEKEKEMKFGFNKEEAKDE